MKIGIDISPLLVRRKIGINWYAYYLVKNLEKIDKKNFYILFGCSIGNYSEKFSLKKQFKEENFSISVKMLPNKLIASIQLFFPLEILWERFDIIHILVQPYYCLNLHCKQVITFHDIGYILFPQYFHPIEVQTFKFAIRRAVKKADRIVAVSHATKEDLVNYLKVKPEKISVIYEGVDDFFTVIDDKERIEKIKKSME